MKLQEFILNYLEENTLVEVYLNFKSNYRGSIIKPNGSDKPKYNFELDDYSELCTCEIKSIGCGSVYDGPFIEIIVKD